MIEDDVFMTPEEVSDYLKISKEHLYKLVQRKKFPKPYKITQQVMRWRKSEVDEFVESKRGESDEDDDAGIGD